MFSYPSILLLMSFCLAFWAGYFSVMEKIYMFPAKVGDFTIWVPAIVPLSYGGFVLWLPISMHFINLTFISHFFYMYFSSVYQEGKRTVGPIILLVIYFGSRLLTNSFFRKTIRDAFKID